MEIREGMTVAEIGAGTGFFSRRLGQGRGSHRQGLRRGHPAPDARPAQEAHRQEGIKTSSPCSAPRPIPSSRARGVDRILLVDVYHEFQKPEPMLAAIRDSLAPGGT